MSGAAALAGLGALRSGTGLVTVAVPESIEQVVASLEPSYMVAGLPEDEAGRLSVAAGAKICDLADQATAIAIGPGWGQGDELGGLVAHLYESISVPLVVDADGLNGLAHMSVPAAREGRSPRVLTPHPGEMSRLLGMAIPEIEADRKGCARQLSELTGAVVVLKGRGTVISGGGRNIVNSTGNSGLATGGSGDVLSGLLAGLLARQMEAFDAARLGVFLHGLAADLAVEELTESGLVASDLPDWIPAAWSAVTEN
tara:strand:- start:507 stop:1274 length:768 start_codon:yes stop_codon:yes gene_type:complete